MPPHIENLPCEILHEIFSFLSSSELKCVSMVCQNFSSVIEESSKLMRKFFIAITNKKRWDFKTIAELRRVHQNLVFFDCDNFPDETLLRGLQNIGSNVKSLELNYCNLYIDEFLKILSETSHLTSLSLIHSKILEKPQQFLNFEYLTQLKLVESEIELELFENASSLREVHIEINDTNTVDLSSFQKILFRQTKLKSLVMINLRLSNLFDDASQACSFQLDSLNVVNCHFKARENFEDFIAQQRALFDIEISISAMKLALDRMRYFDGILERLMCKKKVNIFALNIENYNFTNFNFLPSTQIENLNLYLRTTNFSVINFLKISPNIKSLELDVKELNDEEIKFLNEYAPLTHLKISSLSSENFSRLKLKSIKSLHVETCVEPCHWHKFIESNQGITQLVINFSFLMDFDMNLLNHITQNLKIEHLELIDKYVGFENTIYEEICENCKSLKYLKLWNINIEKNFTDEDKDFLRRKNIKFLLFNDEALNAPMISF